MADEVLAGLNGRFEALCSQMGRPSIPPEMLLQAFFSVRSARMRMEQIDDNLLFRWFVGQKMDAAVWQPTVFTHNRDRLLEAEVARAFLSGLLALKPVKRLPSSDHFSVDGTLIEAWAGGATQAGPRRVPRAAAPSPPPGRASSGWAISENAAAIPQTEPCPRLLQQPARRS